MLTVGFLSENSILMADPRVHSKRPMTHARTVLAGRSTSKLRTEARTCETCSLARPFIPDGRGESRSLCVPRDPEHRARGLPCHHPIRRPNTNSFCLGRFSSHAGAWWRERGGVRGCGLTSG